MTRAYDLYKRFTVEELLSMQKRVCDDPANRNNMGGIHLYKPSARKKLSDIAWAITYHMRDKKGMKK